MTDAEYRRLFEFMVPRFNAISAAGLDDVMGELRAIGALRIPEYWSEEFAGPSARGFAGRTRRNKQMGNELVNQQTVKLNGKTIGFVFDDVPDNLKKPPGMLGPR